MKMFSLYTLLPIVLLTTGCAKKGGTTQSIEQGKEMFSNLYKMEADTCIQLDSIHFLFTRVSEGVQQGDGDSTYIYVLRNENNQWSTLLSKGLMRGMSYSPVVSAEIVNLEGKKYLYMEYDFGGGSMGNNWTDFILYDLKNTINEYTLSLEYYPPNTDYASFVKPSNNLKRGSALYDFLYKKIECNKLFQTGWNTAKAEDTPKMSGWKCYGLLGRAKSVKYADGSYWTFNIDGNLVKTNRDNRTGKPESWTKIITYPSPTKYKINDEYGEIIYKGKTRTEITYDHCVSQGTYIFDDSDRLMEYKETSECDNLYVYSVKYEYGASSEILPIKSVKKDGEYSNAIYYFEYLKTDNRGNWLEVKIQSKITEITPSWDESYKEGENNEKVTNRIYIEKREITYF